MFPMSDSSPAVFRFSDLSARLQREARFIFSSLYSFEAFVYEVSPDGKTILGRRPAVS